MDKDDLFEAFDDTPDNNYLGKKTTRNDNQNPTKGSQEKVEDVTLMKTIESILSSNDISSNLLDDTSLKFITKNFPGGTHEVIYPAEMEEPILKPIETPATTFPFVLDNFQQRSIQCIENHQTVLVSAHTSAGKTVVAQYAIAKSLREHQRVIYTSPIKALSNQKFRELSKKFNDVGLMTGDVTLNKEASCLVMTTEILRNMLYKGTELTKEIAWVIFDEVHYMRDRARGVVWEETMILLSNKINYVFLSATIPNAREFAMWITKLKLQPCNVIYTEFRPVPLQHYVYPRGSDGIFLAVDAKGNFKEENFSKALSLLNNNNNEEKKVSNKQQVEDDIKRIVELIGEQDLNPAIVFNFSKHDCEELANSLSKTDLTTDDEKELIETIYINAMMTLSTEDQELPQIVKMLPILKKGVGIHHGGMLPIVRECVELIFQEGLLKVLFATETFSMGVNMPAKTVVFTNIEKFDGNEHRVLTGGEFIQMSGRAGRRGLDDKGITIVMLRNKIEPEKIREILNGKSDPLNSSYCLNYNQILNMSRIEGVKCEYLVKRSFRQFQAERAVPKLKNEIQDLYNRYKQFGQEWERDEIVKEVLNTKKAIKKLKEENRKIIFQPKNVLKFLTPGRVVLIKNFGIGVVVNLITKEVERVTKYNETNSQYKIVDYNKDSKATVELSIVDMLVYIKDTKDKNSVIPGNIKEKNGKISIVPFLLTTFEKLSSIKINLPKDLSSKSYHSIEQMLFGITKQFKDKIPTMDPVKDLLISDKALSSNIEKLKNLKESIKQQESSLIVKYNIGTTSLDYILNKYKEKLVMRMSLKSLISDYNSLHRLIFQEELANMKRVLHRLEYITEQDIVTLKGQVACNISSADEILLSEMIFNGFFNDIGEEDLATILSCFLSGEGSEFKKEKEKVEKNQHLNQLFQAIKENAERVADVFIECKISGMNKESYMKRFRMDYMIAVMEWVRGEKTFGEICSECEVYEGNIVRTIRRLDELLKELGECARVIGNTYLKEKIEGTSKKIKRGIPFAASLYLTN